MLRLDPSASQLLQGLTDDLLLIVIDHQRRVVIAFRCGRAGDQIFPTHTAAVRYAGLDPPVLQRLDD